MKRITKQTFVEAGSRGGSKTGETKRRGDSAYYAALVAKRWEKKGQAENSEKADYYQLNSVRTY